MTDDPKTRKTIPLATGCFDYFPDALAAVAEVSFWGNEKHNPGEPLHHARGKSNDHADALQRHFTQRGEMDFIRLPDGREIPIRHSAEVAWRALAILQEELEAAGAPLARGARLPPEDRVEPIAGPPARETYGDMRDVIPPKPGESLGEYLRRTAGSSRVP